MPDGPTPPPPPRLALPLWHRDLPWSDPHDAAGRFADVPVLALLDSTGPAGPSARYAYLCVDPFQIVAPDRGDPIAALDAALAPFALAPDPDGMPFRGGAVGYIGYEAGAALEGIPAAPAGQDDPPGVFFGLYDLVIGFDRLTKTCRIHATGLPASDPESRARRAQARMAWAEARLSAPPPQPPPLAALAFRPDWSEAEYSTRLTRLLGYIRAGDIFQANLTMRHQTVRPAGLDGWAVQAALRRRNAAPFGAWLRSPGFDLCCSSPERFIRLGADGALQTQPIKGTIARAADPTADAAAAAALSASAKDRAENVMIVDVLRNDLGRVASLGSVAVPALCALRSYATVHHLVSTITARLRPGLGPADVLRAALPGGSITGAPKIRAMQIIAELEGVRRGPYCGTVAAIGFDGAMDSNIVIRSMVLTPGRVVTQAGGGIVADSSPAGEYAEMMLKAAPMLGLCTP